MLVDKNILMSYLKDCKTVEGCIEVVETSRGYESLEDFHNRLWNAARKRGYEEGYERGLEEGRRER